MIVSIYLYKQINTDFGLEWDSLFDILHLWEDNDRQWLVVFEITLGRCG